MKSGETLDDFFETEAQKQRTQALRDEANPVLQARIAEKKRREQEAFDAGRTV